MVSFRSKKIETKPSVNERLVLAREAKYLTLERVSLELKISKDYLKMLEAGDYRALPGEVYAKNFIRMYTQFLGLDSDEILEQYKRERAVLTNIRPEPKAKWNFQKPAKIISRIQMWSTPKIFRTSAIALVAMIGLLYIGFKVEAIIRPPDLAVTYPGGDILSVKKFIEVKGKTFPQARVFINGQEAFVSGNGEFSHSVNLGEGINEISVSAKKDYSKEVVILRRVVVEKDS